MQNEKMREEFEAWRLSVFCGGENRLNKCANAPDVYYYTEVQSAWVDWQASRESLVIDFTQLNVQHASYNDVDCYAISDVGVILRNAGLKVKP